MLSLLRIKDFAIIDALEVAFGPGLNVVTGETGAGKSILIAALHLVLGARGAPELIRQGAASAEVEALFDIGDDPDLRQRLEAQGITVDEELLIRRVVLANGRSRAYVAGKLATLGQLAEISVGLADIASQHEHHSLTNPSNHLLYLDAFAGLGELRTEMIQRHGIVLEAKRALTAIKHSVSQRAEREDFLRFQLQEIIDLDLSSDDETSLPEERERLRHAERLKQLTSEAEYALYSKDDALCDQLARISTLIEEASRFDARLSDTYKELISISAQLEETSRSLNRYAREAASDPERLLALEQRLERLAHLTRKHGKSLADVLSFKTVAENELAQLQNHEQHVRDLEQRYQDAKSAARDTARALSAKRMSAAKKLGKAISEELRSLGMGDAKVVIEVMRTSNVADENGIDGVTLSANGMDRVEFLIAPNRGEKPRPLHKIASGGELSRSMLAIKRVLTGLGPSGVYVFDEVDAGVGGAIAEVIGTKMHEVSRHHQVICITHLPQIAAFADTHFSVRKAVRAGRTFSAIGELDSEERREELARMLGGKTVTSTTRAAASEMLKIAKSSNTQP
ncbi:MAG: DNA repair protein RecN [Myxococcales bacterium]|nr:DNA repair protein RecN [Myxococcales bacterium]MCB9708932.1 DNA repair protein RecN [Myxococcales bacterium]